MTLVVKLGGGADIDPQALLGELAALDEPWVLVHGGNAELTALSAQLGFPAKFVTSPSGHVSRFTDARTMSHIQMTYRGRINNDLVRRLNVLGCKAVGLSGIDSGILRARRKDTLRVVENGRKLLLRGDHSGTITSVDGDFLQTILQAGRRPVLTLPALADDGTAVNVDGDRAAAAVASALGASQLIILSNVPGLLRDPNDSTTLVRHVTRNKLAEASQFAVGRFGRKMVAVGEALDGGVAQVVLATASGTRPLESARAGHGTVIE